MRRTYRRPYILPSPLRGRSKDKARSRPLIQPEWDDTIHDLTVYQASSEDVMRRKLSRMSRNQMGIALLATARTSSRPGHQLRYSSDVNDDDDDSDAADVCCGHSVQRSRWKQQQQQRQRQLQDGSPSRMVRVDQPHQQQDKSSMHQQQQQPGPEPELMQYACSTAGSEDDVCQWQSPVARGKRQQKNAGSVLQDDQNRLMHSSGAAVDQEKQSVKSGIRQHPVHKIQRRHTSSVEAVTLHTLLDKISLLEHQLHHASQQLSSPQLQLQRQAGTGALQQQLHDSQTQLEHTQAELRQLQHEYKLHKAHTSAIITQLQAQMQQLLSGLQLQAHVHLQQQQQVSSKSHPTPLLPYRSRETPAAAAEALGATDRSSDIKQLLEVSSFIQQQLQQFDSLLPAAPGPARSGHRSSLDTTAPAESASIPGIPAGRAPVTARGCDFAAIGREDGSPETVARHQAAGNPMKQGAASPPRSVTRVAPSRLTCSLSGSPTRKKAELFFTPAFTDSVALPSYAAMKQRRAAAAGHLVAPAERSSLPVTWSSEEGPAAAAAHCGHVSAAVGQVSSKAATVAEANSPGRPPVGSPRRLYTSQALQANLADIQEPFGREVAQPWAGVAVPGALPRAQLDVKVMNTATARHCLPGTAAVWEAEVCSPRAEQMPVPVPAEHARCSLRKAAAECFSSRMLHAQPGQWDDEDLGQSAVVHGHQQGAARADTQAASAAGGGTMSAAALSSDLAALLQDLGLAASVLQDCDLPAASSSEAAAPGVRGRPLEEARAAAGHQRREARGEQLPLLLPVLSESHTAPAAAIAPQLLKLSRGDGVLAGVRDVDRGLCGGLSSAATSRVFTAAGVSDKGSASQPLRR